MQFFMLLLFSIWLMIFWREISNCVLWIMRRCVLVVFFVKCVILFIDFFFFLFEQLIIVNLVFVNRCCSSVSLLDFCGLCNIMILFLESFFLSLDLRFLVIYMFVKLLGYLFFRLKFVEQFLISVVNIIVGLGCV